MLLAKVYLAIYLLSQDILFGESYTIGADRYNSV
jgi:hypothetical protein